MNMTWMLILLSYAPSHDEFVDHVDIIEMNSVYDDEGRVNIHQWIFWQFGYNPRCCEWRFDVVDWKKSRAPNLQRTVPKNLRKSRFQQTTCPMSFYTRNYLKGLIASGLAARLLSSRRIVSSFPITFLPIFALPFTSAFNSRPSAVRYKPRFTRFPLNCGSASP